MQLMGYGDMTLEEKLAIFLYISIIGFSIYHIKEQF